jgi:hypothetical protein
MMQSQRRRNKELVVFFCEIRNKDVLLVVWCCCCAFCFCEREEDFTRVVIACCNLCVVYDFLSLLPQSVITSGGSMIITKNKLTKVGACVSAIQQVIARNNLFIKDILF